MERGYFLLLIILIVLPYVNAGSVGISPAYAIRHFEPNLETTFSFRTFNYNSAEGIGVQLEGDLAKYANLSRDFLIGGGAFEVKLKLPEKLDRPGTHALYVKVIEVKNDTKDVSLIGGVASIRAPIRILVPYPGEYTQSVLSINNVNEGEDAFYKLEIQNLGTDNITLSTYVDVFRIDENGEKVLTQKLDGMFLKTKNVLNIDDRLNTSKLEAGEYFATATIHYGKTEIVNTTFKIGEFLVDIVDYDYLFERDKINQFNIQIENKWNTKIESIFADVTITDEGKVVSTFRTVSLDTNPWESKNITGFFDAEGLKAKRHLANIILHYEGSSSHKLVAIYIQDPPKERDYLKYTLIAVAILSLVAIIGFAILLMKIKKLRGQLFNGKRK